MLLVALENDFELKQYILITIEVDDFENNSNLNQL